MSAASPERIAAVRRFNRFYTRQIGVLRKTYLDSPYSLGEMRVLYELSQAGKLGTRTASDIGRALDLDAGYLSRVLRNFEKRGLISRKASAQDARQSLLALTAQGRRTFTPHEQRSQRDTGAMLGKLGPAQQARLVAAMTEIETLLDGKPAPKTQARQAESQLHFARSQARRFRLDRFPPRRALRQRIWLDRTVRGPVRADRR